jgi:hypothetical protein
MAKEHGFQPKTTHPLDWSDTEIKWMLQVAAHHKSINNTVIYHLMGYDGQRPNTSFLARLDRLRTEIDKH